MISPHCTSVSPTHPLGFYFRIHKRVETDNKEGLEKPAERRETTGAIFLWRTCEIIIVIEKHRAEQIREIAS